MKEGAAMRLGTRGSSLALTQAEAVSRLISAHLPGTRVEIVVIKTEGDAGVAAKGGDRKLAFTKEIDRRLLKGDVDIAVHSLKDVPSTLDSGIAIAATPPRADPRDVMVTASGKRLSDLPEGSAVGTGSIRRKVQLRALRPGLEVVEVRGNVETRIGKLRGGSISGVVLAAAGLERLGMTSQVSQYFAAEEMVPAACQGTLAVMTRAEDRRMLKAMQGIDDAATHAESLCERTFLERLGGDCNFPAGVYAKAAGERLRVVGMLSDADGASLVRGSMSGDASGPEEVGRALAERLLGRGGLA
ncbi:MAG: hydroxymethylbilane synthase [Nitrososphaerota archaeon]|nr:hydroxymethylbilane synthase [Nitrososphaerota archaeon]